MKKRRKVSSTAPVPTRREIAMREEAAAAARLSAGLADLFRFYLERGCPCRFPRLRAVAAGDTRSLAEPGFTSADQQALIAHFDAAVPLERKEALPSGHRATCGLCGSAVERRGEEVFNASWIEHLRIAPAPGLSELGAPLSTPLPRCRPMFAAGPLPHNAGARLVDAAFPKVSIDAWLEWLRAGSDQ